MKKAGEKKKAKLKVFNAKLKSFTDLKKNMDDQCGQAQRMLTASTIDRSWEWSAHDGFLEPIRKAKRAVDAECIQSPFWQHWSMTNAKDWPKLARSQFKDKQIEAAFKNEYPKVTLAINGLKAQIDFLQDVANSKKARRLE